MATEKNTEQENKPAISPEEERLNHVLAELQRARTAYLDLTESCLTGVIYRDAPLAELGEQVYDAEAREYGWDWPSHAHTMVGSKRLNNVRLLTESVIGNQIPGDFIETGVWRGGACIMMRAVLSAYRVTDRTVWVADSFEGLPAPDSEQYPLDSGAVYHEYESLAISQEEVESNFSAYGLLDDKVKFLKGWFKNTLPEAPIEQLAILRLDGDLFESTMDGLKHLYPKLSQGGYVIVDDYHVVPGCKAAVTQFCEQQGIEPELVEIDGVGVFWRKSEA